MAIDKELINLGLNIDQSNKINKLNKKFNQLDKSNKEGHQTSQAMVAAVGLKLHKQNMALAQGMAKVNSMVAKNNTLLKNIGSDLKGLKKGMSQIHATTKDTNQRAIARDNKEEIQDAVKQFVYEAGLEVENIKKNSSSLERFAMYLAISETIKLNSNIKVEIINTIPGKKEFKTVMDSIENGMKDSFEIISEEDLDGFRKLHKANESLKPLLSEYNNAKDELDAKIKYINKIEGNIKREKGILEHKISDEKDKLNVELEKKKAFNVRIKRVFLFFCTAGLSAIINMFRDSSKERKIESIKEKGDKNLESIIDKGNKDISLMNSSMNPLIEKLNSIIPETLTNEIESLEKMIKKEHKNSEKYMELDFLASSISNSLISDGMFSIHTTDLGAAMANDQAKILAQEIEVGKIYLGKVKKLKGDKNNGSIWGVVVELSPNTDGFLHISEVCDRRIKHATDEIQVGDEIKVKVIDVDEQGELKLSRKQALLVDVAPIILIRSID